MTYTEAIEITDRRTNNTYTTDDKTGWLRQLDKQIYDELISKRVNSFVIKENPCNEDELLVPDPYAEDVYVNFLQARIAKENEEYSKYNALITLYNDGFSRFARRYNETHRALPCVSAFRF